MYEIIYVSSSTQPMSAAELDEILEHARIKNQEASVSGILVCHSGSFLQVLEGPNEETVQAVFERIAADDRHHRLLTLKRGEIAERRFGTWRMAYANIDDVALAGDPDVARFLSGGSIHELDNKSNNDLGRAGALLSAFRGGRFRQS